jgi:hypothetical protein
VKDLSYSLAVNHSPWASGTVPSAPRLAPDQKTLVPLHFSVNGLALVKEITDIIIRGTDVAYTCGGNMKLGGDLRGLGDFTIPFSFTGTTKLQR